MANIFNPTDNQVEVTIKGNRYVVGPQLTLADVPEDAAQTWVTNIHQFLQIVDTIAVREPVQEPSPIPTRTVGIPKKQSTKK